MRDESMWCVCVCVCVRDLPISLQHDIAPKTAEQTHLIFAISLSNKLKLSHDYVLEMRHGLDADSHLWPRVPDKDQSRHK
jgi:hypothetical protein